MTVLDGRLMRLSSKNLRRLRRVSGLCGVLLSSCVTARGVSPYLPLNLSPEMERAVERVLVLGDEPVLKRPIAAATVLHALPKACARDADLCERVKGYLANYTHEMVVTHAGITAAASRDGSVVLPNQHGELSDSHWDASFAAFWQPGDHILLNVGAVSNVDHTTATGTSISLGTEYAQLDIGYRDQWLSPLTDSSMLLSTEAPTMPSLTLSNYELLTSLGLSYQLFLAEESRSDKIVFNGRYTSGHPRLAGIHLEIQPTSGWSLGFNRQLQFGGGARGGNSPSAILNAFFNPAARDNTNASLSTDQEQGNQQASFVSSFIYPGKTPFEVYFEYAGEDTFHTRNYMMGNASLSAGIHLPALWRRFDLTYEISEWQNEWWTHHIYQDGLTNEGFVLGHWGGDWRVRGDGVGARSQMFKLAYSFDDGSEFQLRYRNLKNQSYSPWDYRPASDLTLSYARPWRSAYFGGELEVGRDVFGEKYSRLSAFLRFAPRAFPNASIDVEPDNPNSEGASRFVDVGFGSARLHYDVSDFITPTRKTTVSGAHFAVGARRAVSDFSDLGVRVELDELSGKSLIALRALDYRRRFGRHFAMTGFLGAARYSAPTSAMGWYGGIGAQWRDLLPKWDLSFDLRRGEGLQRDKLLPGETQTGRPDEVYVLTGAATYISYRF